MESLYDEGMDTSTITDGGFITVVPQEPAQIVYLDFDGADTQYNNRELDLDIDVSVADSGLSEERISLIVAQLNEDHLAENITFVAERPVDGEYSTVFIGKTNAFDSYGSFAGLAETIDSGNQIKNDDAFVFADATWSNNQIISVIDHEVGHLQGEEHAIKTNLIYDFSSSYSDQYYNLGTISSDKTINGSVVSPNSNHYTFVAGVSATITIDTGVELLDALSFTISGTSGELKSFITQTTYTITQGCTYILSVQCGAISNQSKSYSIKLDFPSSGGGSGGGSETPTTKPDLMLDSLTLSSSTVSSSDSITVSFSPKNAGTGSAAACTIAIKVDGQLYDTYSLKSLGSGVSLLSAKKNFSCSGLSAGSHKVEVEIDYYDNVDESNEYNNVSTVYFTVTGSGNSGGGGSGGGGSVVTGQPDLRLNYRPTGWSDCVIISTHSNATSSSSSFTEVNDVYARFAFENAGTAASGKFYISVSVDGYEEESFVCDGLQSGYYSTAEYNLGKLSAGYHTITIKTDSEYDVSESNESNNSVTKTIYVAETPYPDLLVSNVTESNFIFDVSEPMTLSFTITNQGTSASSNSLAYIYIGNTKEEFDSVWVSALAPGKSQTLTYTFPSNSFPIGNNFIYVEADGAGWITESDENNNKSSTLVGVTAPAELEFVSTSFSTNTLTTQEYCSILSVEVANTGDKDASAFYVSIYDEYDNELWESFVYDPALKAGETQVLELYVIGEKLHLGENRITIKLDPLNDIHESNENNNQYTLFLDYVDKTAPTVTVSQNITAPTNQAVTVYAEFEDAHSSVVSRQYSYDGAEWFDYSSGGVTVYENVSIYFRATDSAGNTSHNYINRYQVTNIDITPPEAAVVSANITNLTNQNVTVTATFSADTYLKQYRIDGGSWKTYTGGITVTKNCLLEFRGRDEAGNYSEISTWEVSNIDKTPPVKPGSFSADIVSLTNQNVTVHAEFSEDSYLKQYRIQGNSDWTTYTAEGVTVTDNCIIEFRGRDRAGNYSETSTFVVANIDRTGPKIVLTPSTTDWTNGEVVLSASFSDRAEITEQLYSLDNETWQTYDSPLAFSENQTVYFKAVDIFGNTSQMQYSITNIDHEAPVFEEISQQTQQWVNHAAVVTVKASDPQKMGTVYYCTTEEPEWKEVKNSQVAVLQNTSVTFKAVDVAGNETISEPWIVSNIDTELPLAPQNITAETIEGVTYIFWDAPEKLPLSGISLYEISCGESDPERIDDYQFLWTKNCETKVIYPYSNADLKIKVWSVSGSGQKNSATIQHNTTEYVARQTVTFSRSNLSVDISANTPGSIKLYTAINKMSYINIADDMMYSENSKSAGKRHFTVSYKKSGNAKQHRAVQDYISDVFFAQTHQKWGLGFSAEHAEMGEETVSLAGKNKIADVFNACEDKNILYLTDTGNGDALFVEDMYTENPGSGARVAQIDEIRAGAGNDVIDFTSQQFDYDGYGVIFRGGDGHDVIWSNDGENMIFGDEGNDRLVGGMNNDILVGGAGNDSMLGGGGDDIFCFGEKFGNDTVSQVNGGSITLWFESGSSENWNSETGIYDDGNGNTVTVSSVVSVVSVVSVIFGDNGGTAVNGLTYTQLKDLGAFSEYSTKKVFEEEGTNSVLAVL